MLSRRNGLLAVLVGSTGFAVRAFGQIQPKRPDLADIAAGLYAGSIISDARGPSVSNVRVSVKRTGSNTIYVLFDHPRLPPFSAKLNRYMSTIQKVGGPEVFLLNTAKQPNGLDVTDDDASWSGTRI